jgi:hypothetical protein
VRCFVQRVDDGIDLIVSYYWTFTFSSPKYRKILSWLIGCKLLRQLNLFPQSQSIVRIDVNTAAYIAGMASVDWGVATQIMAAANIGSDGKFIATTAQI